MAEFTYGLRLSRPASLFDHCMKMSTHGDLNKLTELCAIQK